MKILSTEQVRQADAFTIAHEPIASIDLMERAAQKCADWLEASYPGRPEVQIFCGLGNNGGDGLVIARILAGKNWKVNVYIVRYSDKCSSDFLVNEARLKALPSNAIHDIRSAADLDELKAQSGIIIDAIFGSGLNRPLEGIAAEAVDFLNTLTLPKIAIDVPSGLPGSAAVMVGKSCLQASHTLTFQSAKLVFMFPGFGKYIGDFTILDIGLDPGFIKGLDTINYFTTFPDIKALIKPRPKFSHKGTFGDALIIAGSYGKMGAAVLASGACIKSGVGLLTSHIPACGYVIMQTALPEAMVSIDEDEHSLSILPDLEKYNSIGIGPGLGMEEQCQNIVKLLIQNAKNPLVVDADALNILSENKTWLSFLPKNSILTPHPGEFQRLAGKADSDYERYGQLRDFAFKYGVYVILKGAHTAIATPDGRVYFNSTGNPGMAKGGSGDVLTGILTGLLAQGYTPLDAAVLGVYWHGLAGDIAAGINSQPSMCAGDIIENLGRAFKTITE